MLNIIKNSTQFEKRLQLKAELEEHHKIYCNFVCISETFANVEVLRVV